MSEKKISDKITELIKADEERKKNKPVVREKMTFEEYLRLLEENPRICQLAHERIFDMIMSHGEEAVSEQDSAFFDVTKQYPFFEKDLKGVKRQISQVMDYFKGGAQGLSIGKKILLLFGPPSSGKSSFMEVLKDGLEAYETVPMYKIEGCDELNEEPLHLLPKGMRKQFEDALGIKMKEKAELCPKCRAKLESYIKEYGPTGYYKIPVVLFKISKRKLRGIGRFEPADEKAQDASDLSGKENVAVTCNPNRGYNDPMAYTLNGAVPRGNRGLVEGVEFVKKNIDPRTLWTFIDLNEEGILNIPGSNIPPVSVDTVVIGHCNIAGYKWFAGDPAHEAIQSRIHAVPFGYALRVKDEVEIYKKLLNQSRMKTHIAPGTLELVALFAVSTRLNSDNRFNNTIEKAQFMNGQVVESVENKKIDIRSVIAKGQESDDWSKRDGMFGLSPRDVMSALSKAIVSDKISKCLTPNKAMKFLLSTFDHMMGVSPDIIKEWKKLLLGDINVEYKKILVETINTAFLSAYGDLAREKARRYMEDVKLDRQRNRRLNAPKSVGDGERTPDYEAMKKIERHLGFSDSEAQKSRGEYYEMYNECLLEQGEFNMDAIPRLRDAVNAVLLEEMCANILNILTISDRPVTGKDADTNRKHREDLIDGLKKAGYCEFCVYEIMEEARRALKR